MSEADLLLKAATEKAEGYEVNSLDPGVETSEFFVLLISLCVLGLLFVIGIGTNAILLWAFYRRPKLRTISNRFVGNLVVINLLSTILLIPLVCIDVTPPSLLLFGHYFNHPARCVVSKLASAWVSTSSVFGTLLIGVDQYLAIVYPLRYQVIFGSTKAWIVLSLCWFLCILVATVASITNEPSLWLICGKQDSFQILLVNVEDNFALLPISKFIFLYLIPLLLIALIYIRIYMAAKANIEKLRLRTAFNSMDYNGLAPSIGARQNSTANNLSYKNSLDSNLSKTSSCDQEFPRKGSSDTIALDGDLFLQSRSGSFTQTRSGSFTQFTQTRSGSFTQRLARSASNASTTLISNIRKRVLATHNFIRKHKEELHTAKISLIIVALFMTCWMPFHVINLLMRVQLTNVKDLPQWFICLIHILVVVYPSLSPCIFAFRCKKLQRELKKMVNNERKFSANLPDSYYLSAKPSRNQTDHLSRPEFSRFSVPPVVRKSGIIVQNGQNQFITRGESTTRIPKSSSSSALKNLSA